jgi:hypothetical protein
VFLRGTVASGARGLFVIRAFDQGLTEPFALNFSPLILVGDIAGVVPDWFAQITGQPKK